jgi:hypothetical protein
MIKKQTATVYYAPARGRRFFTLTAAIRAEAKARLDREFNDPGDDVTPPSHWVRYQHHACHAWSDKTQKLFDDMCAEVKKEFESG